MAVEIRELVIKAIVTADDNEVEKAILLQPLQRTTSKSFRSV